MESKDVWKKLFPLQKGTRITVNCLCDDCARNGYPFKGKKGTIMEIYPSSRTTPPNFRKYRVILDGGGERKEVTFNIDEIDILEEV